MTFVFSSLTTPPHFFGYGMKVIFHQYEFPIIILWGSKVDPKISLLDTKVPFSEVQKWCIVFRILYANILCWPPPPKYNKCNVFNLSLSFYFLFILYIIFWWGIWPEIFKLKDWGICFHHLYWPEVSLKVWAKSELFEFLHDLGCA